MSQGIGRLGRPAGSWASAEFGIALTDRGSPVGLTIDDLVEVGLRRNPRRAQLLVSTVLGKHLAADPRTIAGAGRLLGALVAATLNDDRNPVPAAWISATRRAVSGAAPGALIEVLDAAPERTPRQPVLVLGFAETATALGHLVADQVGSSYLHSTRRVDGPIPVAATFSEPHSHATGHLLRPDPAALLAGPGPVVLVDDELSTGRTALNVIEALHTIAPRDRYVMAGLVDVRAPRDELRRAAVADRLGCRIDVVSLVRGGITVLPGTVERIAATMQSRQPLPRGIAGGARRIAVSGLALSWPVGVPDGGRHGLGAVQRAAFDAAVPRCASALSAACGSATRVLVVGTEEFMYLPLRLSLELARDPSRRIAFQSTTRSPVHVVDAPGYPISRRIDFRGGTVGSGDEGSTVRHLYNACWPAGRAEADLVLVIDDGHAVEGPDGVAAAVAAATGAPVVLAVLGPGPPR